MQQMSNKDEEPKIETVKEDGPPPLEDAPPPLEDVSCASLPPLSSSLFLSLPPPLSLLVFLSPIFSFHVSHVIAFTKKRLRLLEARELTQRMTMRRERLARASRARARRRLARLWPSWG